MNPAPSYVETTKGSRQLGKTAHRQEISSSTSSGINEGMF